MIQQIKEQITKTINDAVKALSTTAVSQNVASAAIRGSVQELIDAYEKEIKKKEEQISGYKKALKLADDQMKELKKEKGISNGSHAANKKDEKLKEMAKERKAKPKSERTITFKEKTCKVCGKTFTPRYGAQTICDSCKDKVIPSTQKDIEDTAKLLAEM